MNGKSSVIKFTVRFVGDVMIYWTGLFKTDFLRRFWHGVEGNVLYFFINSSTKRNVYNVYGWG